MKLLMFLPILAGLIVATASVVTAAPPKTTFVLACDRGVGSAQVTVQLRTEFGGALVGSPVSMSCGPDSTSGLKTERLIVPLDAGWADIAQYFVETADFTGGCLGGTVIPAKLDCPNTGARATLTIR